MGFVNLDNGVVNICPNNTKGKIITIDNLNIQLPEVPDKEKILFHDKPKAEQFWQRLEVPKAISDIESNEEWNLKDEVFKKKWTPYIKEEWRRRREGVWFYNCGVPTYLTGKHYMLLQWHPLEDGYAFFIEPQWKIYIHWQACIEDPRSFGQVHAKNRRSGYSSIEGAEITETISGSKRAIGGIISMNAEEAQKTLFTDKVVLPFKSYPFFFQPISNAAENPKSVLSFAEPGTKRKKASVKAGVGNDSEISWKATDKNSYDGKRLARLVVDEAGKWKMVDIEEYWQIVKPCFRLRTRIVGKCMMGSTVNPMKDGGEQFKRLYETSDVSKRGTDGRTISGLYSLFIPAYETVVLDKYGRSVIEDPVGKFINIDGEEMDCGGKTYLLRQRKSLADTPDKLNEFIRQFPFTIEEAFRDSAQDGMFNLTNIYEQINHNEHLKEIKQFPVRKGRFIWKDGERFCNKVSWTDDPKGNWEVSFFGMQEEDACAVKYERGKYYPKNDWLGAGGVDPYKVDKTADGRGSNASCHIVFRTNMKYPGMVCVARYNGRPQTVELSFEEMLMGAIYFGVPLLIENNVRRMIEWLKDNGYGGFVMNRPKTLRAKSSNIKNEEGIPSNSEDVLNSQVFVLQNFIQNHIGQNEDGTMNQFYFNDTLSDLAKFNPKDRTKNDDSVSLSLALLAIQTVAPKPQKETTSDLQFIRLYPT